jgi:predicted transcriptional regulator
LTWEQVKSGGVSRSDAAYVKFASGGAGGGLISIAQAKRLFAIAKQAGRTDEQIKTYLKKHHKIEHTKDIPKEIYDEVCDELQNDDYFKNGIVESQEVGQ